MSSKREERTDLVEYVEQQRELDRNRRDIERRRAEAGVLTRAKWWLVEMDTDDADD